ncbi:uncharacterized protein [Ptychodera flava]|uniref:uncharacterized protein n=1 Tax=Ptychodera flava TaxID=63121 RepID=UPI003969D2DF
MQQYQPQNYPQQRVIHRHPVQQSSSSTNMARQGFPKHAITALSICQIVLGGLSVILGIISIFIGCTFAALGTGIWCGILFSASGSIGLVSVCKKTRATMTAFMILSIISVSLALPILGVISILSFVNEYNLPQFAVDMLLLVIAAIETAVGIIASVLCCRAVCYCGSKNVMYGVPLQIQTLGDGTSNNSIRLASHPSASSDGNRITQQLTYAVLTPVHPYNLDSHNGHQYGMPETTYQAPIMPFHDQPLQHPMMTQQQHPTLQQWVQPPNYLQTTPQARQTGPIQHPLLPAPSPQQAWPRQNLQIPESQARRPQQPPEQLQQQQGQRELTPAQQHPSPNIAAVEGTASNNYDRVSSSPPPEYVVDDEKAGLLLNEANA